MSKANSTSQPDKYFLIYLLTVCVTFTFSQAAPAEEKVQKNVYHHPQYLKPNHGKLHFQAEEFGECMATLVFEKELERQREATQTITTNLNITHDFNLVPQTMKCRRFIPNSHQGSKKSINCSFNDDPLLWHSFRYYLAGFQERPYDFSTEHEDNLRKWILDQPDHSVTPFAALEYSMQLNNFNLWNSLLTLHQLFRNEVRWHVTSLYNYNSSFENEAAFINKLIDIRGNLVEASGKGDHGGSWYRIWAGLLERLSWAIKTNFDHSWSDSAFSLILSAGAEIESAIAYGQADSGKFAISTKSNLAATYFLLALQRPFQSERITLERCRNPSSYLHP